MTIIDLSGIDLSQLTPENFLDLTKEAGKNPGPDGIARGYRLRIPKDLARRTIGKGSNPNEGDLTLEEARKLRLTQLIEEFNGTPL